MDWQALIKAYEGFLKLEKGLSSNSIEAYLSDIGKLEQFLELSQMEVGPEELERKDSLFLSQPLNKGMLSGKSRNWLK